MKAVYLKSEVLAERIRDIAAAPPKPIEGEDRLTAGGVDESPRAGLSKAAPGVKRKGVSLARLPAE